MRPLGAGQRQRGHPPGGLSGQANRLAAGSQNRELRASHAAAPRSALAQASSRCSQLSSTSSNARTRSAARSVASSGCPASSCTPTAAATAAGTLAGSMSDASSAIQTPCGKRSSSAPATCRASRVFPVPPGPVRVSRRVVFSSRCTSASSLSRPMKLVSWAGRLCTLPSQRLPVLLRRGPRRAASARTMRSGSASARAAERRRSVSRDGTLVPLSMAWTLRTPIPARSASAS